MVLLLEHNRRLPPKRKYNIVTVSIVIGFCIAGVICLLGYFALSSVPVEDETIQDLDAENADGIVLDESEFNENLTSEQNALLNQFRENVAGNLTHAFMKSGFFLIQWLKEKEWDLDDAQEMLLNHLEWRKENGIDDPEFERIFSFDSDGVDKGGRPVIAISIADWDVRKEIIAGRGEKYLKFVYHVMEHGVRLIRKFHSRNNNITQILFLVNLDSYSLVQHGCFSCIQLYLTILYAIEDNYPGYSDILYKTILINTPTIFDIILSLAPEGVKKSLEVYGSNKLQWQEAILRFISPDQIPPEFGGTKQNDLDY